MWLITPRGFYSAVEKAEDRAEGMVTIRARVKADLGRLSDLIPSATPYRVDYYSDYAWRIRVTRDEWAAAVNAMALEIDYPNFKDEVKRVQGKTRANIYMRVWSALHSLQHRPRRSTVPMWDDDEFDSWRAR